MEPPDEDPPRPQYRGDVVGRALGEGDVAAGGGQELGGQLGPGEGVFSISWEDAGVSRAGRRKDMGSMRLMAMADAAAEAEAADGEEVAR